MEVLTAAGPMTIGANHKPLEGVTAPMGHNAPPDPFDAFALHIDDLFEQAEQFLDGEGIQTDAQAEDVSRILNMLRKAEKDADEARKAEKKPHDDAAKAVQAKWSPLLGKAKLAAETAKRALAPFLQAKEDAQRAAAEAAAEEARQKAAAARKAAEQAAPDDLAGQTTAKVLQEQAAEALKQAERLDKQKAHAKGGERAVGLRDVYTPVLTEPKEALRHYMQAQPDALKEWLLDQARRDVRVGKRSIPGFTIEHERVAV